MITAETTSALLNTPFSMKDLRESLVSPFSKGKKHPIRRIVSPVNRSFRPSIEPPKKDCPKFTRRLLIAAGAVTITTGAALLLEPWKQFDHLASAVTPSPQPPTPEPSVRTDQTHEVLQKIQQEIVRLASLYPDSSPVRTVYLGNLQGISSVYQPAINIGIADPRIAYARTGFGKAEYSPAKRFRYFLKKDGSIKDYATLEHMVVSIFLSPTWLSAQNDDIKKLALEKEAYTLAQYEGFSRLVLNTYLAQGRVEKIDPNVTDIEISRTFARNLLIENPQILKLYDYAAYLLVLNKVGELKARQNPQIDQELAATNLPKIYQQAKGLDINFHNLSFGSREFWDTAFNPEGSWVKMISDPSIPGPASLF